MKRVFLLAALIGLCFYLFRGLFDEKHVLRVGVECDYVPNSWIEGEQTDSNIPVVNEPGHFAEGYDIQIAKLVAEEIGIELQIFRIEWNSLLDELNKGNIDAIFSGMLDTKERREKAAFSDVYDAFDNEFLIIVDKSSKYVTARTLADFSGAKIVGQGGTILDDLIAQIAGAEHMPPADSVTAMVKMVNDGKADGAVINLDTGESYQRKFDNLRLIRFREGDGFKLDFSGTCAAVRKKDTKLLYDINKALRGISKWNRQKTMDRTIARAWRHLPEE